MAKTRAQRKAERRAREAEEQKRSGSERSAESRAQHDTQIGVSGDVAEIEAIEAGIAAGAEEADLETPDAPQETSRSVRRAEAKAAKQADRRERDEQKRRERDQLARQQKKATAERQSGPRGGVIGFLLSCWAELKKVQWPDRETLVQATAVTIIFVAVAAAYLGALDALFNWLVKQIL
ncbi:MAG TPA: preprotein translocase subunit SecE [Solirubrobacterales bacterium]|jgi:preprotein translocase SecE subunit|nr:preprotein translocase subunit SecE [Solirubrobacterales bacterium]